MVAAGAVLASGSEARAEHRPPKLWHTWVWLDPEQHAHRFTIEDLGSGAFKLKDHTGQTGTATFNRDLNRFDVVEGPLKGYGFHIPEFKQFVLVTKTGSIALYKESLN
ncbi:MAG: hypothetical protein K2X82_05165 [Gemmataceae bacterium]|nr:hypothetical protein [Gemmataceae bacterium]